MPSNNRRLPRPSLRTSLPPIIPGFTGEPSSSRYSPLGASVPTLPAVEPPQPPKHFPFPSAPLQDDLLFEGAMATCVAFAMGCQYLQLYRTVWWLGNSYTRQAMNFYLIDLYLVAFIMVLLSRRLVYLLGCKAIEKFAPPKLQQLGQLIYRFVLFGIICGMLIFCAFNIMQNYHIMNILYLCYPALVYVILFGSRISPLFEMVNWDPDILPPLHACSSNPAEIRSEVENLKTNFNNRMKQILFSSVVNSYYAGFLPCCFAPSALHYDVYWSTQHAIFIFLSSFVAYTVHILSLRYCDVLHRSALHLGTWDKLENRNSLSYSWNEDLLWPSGTVVRYGRDLFKAQGECNAAEPGNTAYSRFYVIFKNPSMSLSLLLSLHVLTVFYQLVLLLRCSLWYNIVSVTFMLFFNYYILYRLVRDYLVSYKIYKQEKIIHDKINLR